jgi:transcriptional regulator with XRE-family HTH domain
MKDPNIVGRTVARVRDAQDISQRELANLMDHAGFPMSRGRIMNWERGRADITICELAEVARICRTHRIEFVPKPAATADAGLGKRGLSCKVIVTVEFLDDSKQQTNRKMKSTHRVQNRRRKA